MQPEEFIEVAAALPRAGFCTAEARVRSTAGRAYYGVFNRACRLLRAYEIEVGRDHGRVPTKLYELASSTGDERFSDLAAFVGDLYQARKKADYELDLGGRWADKLKSPEYGESLVSKGRNAYELATALINSAPPSR